MTKDEQASTNCELSARQHGCLAANLLCTQIFVTFTYVDDQSRLARDSVLYILFKQIAVKKKMMISLTCD